MSTYPVKRIVLPPHIVELLDAAEGTVVLTDEADREVARAAVIESVTPAEERSAITTPSASVGSRVEIRPSGLPVLVAPPGTPVSTIDIVAELRRDREVRGLPNQAR